METVLDLCRRNRFFASLWIIFLLFPGCVSVKNNYEAFDTIALKYPVVLVHGVAAHDRGKTNNSWGRIPEILKKSGVAVFFGNTDAWGDIESNAEMLKTTIDKILSETKNEKVNIIAHSKGGIDARYFIWRYDYGSKVASLTTISTPHNGSEIADLLSGKKIVYSEIGKKIIAKIEDHYKDDNPNLYHVITQLTTDSMNEFNKNILMDSKVYYQSYYAAMNESSDYLLFYFSHKYIKGKSGENDGVVSGRSAKWGYNVKKIEGGISHVAIIDIKKPRQPGIDIPTIYLNIVSELAEMGF